MGPRGMMSNSRYPNSNKKGFSKSDWIISKRVAKLFKPYKKEVIFVLIAIFLTTGLGLINPLMIKYVFDDAIGKRNLHLLVIFVIIMVITPMISGIIGVGQTYLNNLVGQNVMRDLRNRLFAHLQRMPLRFFTLTKTGEMQSRLSNDIGGVQGVITDTVTTVVANLSIALSTVIAMFILSLPLTIVSLILLPIFLWITYKVGHVRRNNSEDTQKSLASLTAIMQETLSVSGVVLIKTYGRQQFVQDRFEKENTKLSLLQIRQQMIGRWFFMFVGTFFSIIPAFIYLVAGMQIIHDPIHATISLGGIVAFTTLQSRLFFPIGQLLNIQVEIQGAFALFERIFEYMDMPIEIVNKKNALKLSPKEVKGKVEYIDVTFGYKRDDAKLDVKEVAKVDDLPYATTIKNVNLSVLPGQLAALVGPSGAGKTTLTYLLSRLYDVDSGEILIDGKNIKDISLKSLGGIIGVVTQETYLFNASIRENLLFAKPDASDEELIEATKAAAIHDRIMDFEDGYETIVGERGYKLSGGEKQRIAIARVILKDPPILILDEATSALDTRSEKLIQASFEKIMKNRTTFAIAHRLSTILAADKILVVDRGEIVEQGTHQDLLKKDGLYAQLYNEQFAHRKNVKEVELIDNIHIQDNILPLT